jgi:quercetin dioxygenase-like cupin family protein
MRIIRQQPPTLAGPEAWFTGTVWYDEISGPSDGFLAGRVHFSPGARTAWHAHPGGQVLHVLEGTGRVQDRGGPVEELRAGETVVTEAGVWHWHGAAPSHFMTHVAIYDGATEWGDHVTDAEYGD